MLSVFTLLACFGQDEPYWIERTDAELAAELGKACTASLADGKPVFLLFSAPWCPDCKAVRRLSTGREAKDELQNWHTVVADVGNFDRHTDLLAAFGVRAIAFGAALKPTDCSEPPQRWPRLKVGVLEPPKQWMSYDFAKWLVLMRS